jgi:hypothetical protein
LAARRTSSSMSTVVRISFSKKSIGD